MRHNKCPKCGIQIEVEDKKFLQISDRPKYKNIFWHKHCWKSADITERMELLNAFE